MGTDVWMILRKSCPVRGLKMKMAPLMGLVVRLPSKVLWMVTRYTLVSSTNLQAHMDVNPCAAYLNRAAVSLEHMVDTPSEAQCCFLTRRLADEHLYGQKTAEAASQVRARARVRERVSGLVGEG